MKKPKKLVEPDVLRRRVEKAVATLKKSVLDCHAPTLDPDLVATDPGLVCT